MPTNREVFRNGEELDNWACDVDPETGETESSGGTERWIEYKGKRYTVVTDWVGDVILRPDDSATEYYDDECQDCSKLGENTCGNDTHAFSCFEQLEAKRS